MMLPAQRSFKCTNSVGGLIPTRYLRAKTLMPFDLKQYAARFDEVTRHRYKQSYDLPALEKDFATLRNGERHLSARDVLKLFDPTRTPYGTFWTKPSQKELDAMLSSARVKLSPVPLDEVAFIDSLVRKFHSIGLVSLILRFVHPDRYGIFSTPIVHLLNVHRPHTSELYVAYCQELRTWREHFGMSSVAGTELALWTYLQIAAEVKEGEEQVRAFDSEIWIQRRRVSQALSPFLEAYGPLELARILVYLDPNLAGKIAGEEYETRLRVARDIYTPKLPMKMGWAEALLDQLTTIGRISPEENVALREVWKIRNAAVHAGRKPTPEEVEKMIDAVERVCSRWATVVPRITATEKS